MQKFIKKNVVLKVILILTLLSAFYPLYFFNKHTISPFAVNVCYAIIEPHLKAYKEDPRE